MSIRINWQIPVSHRDYNRMPASVWIRCLQLLPYLEELGFQSSVNDPDGNAKIHLFVRQQDQSAYDLAKRLKAQGHKVIFDLVVNYLDLAEVPHVGRPVQAKHQDEVRRMLSLADVVTCASRTITRRVGEEHPAVRYLPDSIDRRHFHHSKDARDFERATLRAIWSGSPNKVGELTPILPLLRERHMGLTVITAKSHLPEYVQRTLHGWRIPYRFVLWRYASFPRNILRGDLNIVYRATDNSYNQGHSFFKIGVFMAEGVPTLASPVPAYAEVIQDGSNGRICHTNTIEEWAHALDIALEDRRMLAQWSSSAICAMEPFYTGQIAREYADLFHALHDS